MKQLRSDLDFSRTYGSMPDSFAHRVQYALRQTQEEKTMKRSMLRTVAIVLILLTFTTAACAVILSRTREIFGQIYPSKSQLLNAGEVAISGASFELAGVRFTLDDAVWTESGLYAVGTMRAADGANLVLISDDNELDDPVGYPIHYNPHIVVPEGTPTYRQLVEATGAKLVSVSCHFDNQISSEFPKIICTPGAGFYAQEDGSILFATECDLDSSDLEALRGGQCRIRFSVNVMMYDDQLELTDQCVSNIWEVSLVPEA